MAHQSEEVVDLQEKVFLYKELYEVTTGDGVKLIITRKRPILLDKNKTPILLIHGLGQNRYTFDLSKRSLVNYLVKNGYDVYNAELRGHGLSRANGSPYPKTFDEYVDFDSPALIQFVRKFTGHDRIFIIGHSLGGTITYCMSPDQQEYIKGIIPIAGPSHFGRGAPFIKNLATILRFIQKTTMVEKVLPDFFLIDVIGLLVSPIIDLFDHPMNQVLDQIWYPRSIERDILLERVGAGFDRTGITVIGIMIRWAQSGQFLDAKRKRNFEDRLKDIRIPTLFVLGDKDSAVPAASAEIAFQNIQSIDKTWREFGMQKDGVHFGHCDLICGKEAPRIVWPYILKWLQERD